MTADTDQQRVRDLLPDRYDNIDAVMRKEAEEAPDFAGRGFPDFLWAMIGNKAADAVAEALDFNVFGVFALAWCKSREIKRYAQESLDKRDVPIELCLGEHNAATTLKPAIEIDLMSIGKHRIPLDLELKAVYASAELTLLNGAIASIGAGKCKVTAQLKCGGEKLHKAKESEWLVLGSPLVLKQPVQVVVPPTVG